jgi:hypothetical protein
VAVPEEKTKGQLLYEKHAQEVRLISPWGALGKENRDRYERKAAGKFERKPYTKPTKTNERTKKVPEKDENSTKTSLPPWNEAWGDSVKVAWLEAVSCSKS